MKPNIHSMIMESISKLKLDLSDLHVYAEAGSNNYIYTPIICSLAGAERTYAIIKDSKYGRKEDIKKQLLELINKFNAKNIEIVHEKKADDISDCDIICNLGFVRPVDKGFIDNMKNPSVVSLMYEAWEFRDRDIDLKYCKKKQVPVLGVNEDDERIKIMDYVGELAKKKAQKIGAKSIALLGNGKFADKISEHMNCDVFQISKFQELIQQCSNYDTVILAEHSENNKIIFDEHALNNIDNISFIQIAGGLIDYSIAKERGLKIYPDNEVKAGYMGWTLAELGPKPVIDLHTAGLKVGEIGIRNIKHYGLDEGLECSSNDNLVQIL